MMYGLWAADAYKQRAGPSGSRASMTWMRSSSGPTSAGLACATGASLCRSRRKATTKVMLGGSIIDNRIDLRIGAIA